MFVHREPGARKAGMLLTVDVTDYSCTVDLGYEERSFILWCGCSL